MCILNSSVSWKITPLYFFSLNNIYFTEKDPIKVKIFETFECYAQVKICQIPYANFETTSRFLFKFCIPPQFHERKLLQCTFFSSNKIYFFQKEHIKMKISQNFKCLGQNSSNTSSQLWNGKLFPLQILRHSSWSWQITPL